MAATSEANLDDGTFGGEAVEGCSTGAVKESPDGLLHHAYR